MNALLLPLILVLTPDLALSDSPEVQHIKYEAFQRGFAEYYTFADSDWIFWRWKTELKLKVLRDFDR